MKHPKKGETYSEQYPEIVTRVVAKLMAERQDDEPAQ